MDKKELENDQAGYSGGYQNAGYENTEDATGPAEPPPDYNDVGPESSASSYHPEILHPGSLSGDPRVGKNGKPITMWKVGTDGQVESGSNADEEEGETRDVWDNQLEFLLSCISMSVGLGNVWRFPFVAYDNGGGVFIIPYLVVLVLIGRPIYYLEMCLGQFASSSQVKIWSLSPLFKGVGYGSIVGTICVVSYYCSVMAQTVFYFIASFNKDLPWSYCNDDWGEGLCDVNGTLKPELNVTNAALYYELEVFPIAPNIDDGLGDPDLRLSFCLLFSWVCIFLSLVKGVKSSGKVAYFTAIFPYVVMLILLIRGVTLPGAGKGLEYLFTPEWDKLYDPQVWYAAVSQCFFSLSTGFGPIIMFSSYNPFRHNVYRDAWVISFMDTFTSLLASCTIFSVLGYLSEESGLPIQDVAKGGTGLAFVSYPEAIAKFDWVPQLFSVLFFLMLFTLGIGSATSLAGGVISIICDQFPLWKRWLVTLIVSVIGFFMGLMYVTPGGNFMIELVDRFGANFVIYVMAMVEVGAIAWVYGLTNILDDIEFMSGRRPGWYWKACWGFIIPVGLFGILIYALATQEEINLGGIAYPRIAIALGWTFSAFALALLPGWGLQAILSRKAPTFYEKFREALRPSAHWGPKNPKIRREWLEFKKSKNNS